MKTIFPRILKIIPVIFLLIFCCILASPIYPKPLYTEPDDSFFLENNRGRFMYVEVSLPKGEGPFPVVFMAHGFSGTIHSGGAMELGTRLAEAGIIAIRCDFNPYLAPNKKAERTNSYALRDMEDDAVTLIKYALDNYDADINRIGIYGRSFGGRLAMSMANESIGGYDYKAMALVAPAGDDICMERFFNGKGETFEEKRQTALQNGYDTFLGVKLYPNWFDDVKTYTPCNEGYKFNDKPVLLFYNTLDKVVYPDTSLRCANAYSNCQVVKVTSEDGHGYEMGFETSPLKDMIMSRITDFFRRELLN